MVLNSGEQNLKCISFKNNFQWSVKNFPWSSIQQAQRKNTVKATYNSTSYLTTKQAIEQSPFFLSYTVYILRLKIFTQNFSNRGTIN